MTRLVRLWWSLLEQSGLRPGYATEAVDDVPDVLEPRRIYLVGDQSMPWSAALCCPCGCGATIQLSLVAGDTPSWRVRRHFSGSVTLHPSIWRKTGCRSHFFLRRGRIVWSRPQGSAASSSQCSQTPPLSHFTRTEKGKRTMRDSRKFQLIRKRQMNISLIHSSRLFALVLALSIPASSAAAEPMSKVYDCDGRKMEIFEPKDGVMEARVEDLTVRISVRDGG